MGKGTIVSETGDGLYAVELVYDRSAILGAIAKLEANIIVYQAIIDNPESSAQEVAIATIKKVSSQKRIAFLEDPDHVPQNATVNAWCLDLTTGLTGDVGTIEIARERGNGVNIQPGYSGNAVYDGARDGQLIPLMAQSPAGSYFNLAVLPGTQKWKPMFRYATITEIDYDADTCAVSLSSVYSSQQNLTINQTNTLTGVSVEYMTCNASAFSVGDEVVVKFDYDWATPKVIGFKENPERCCFYEPFDGPLFSSKFGWIEQLGTGAFLAAPQWNNSIVDGKARLHMAAQSTTGRRVAQIYYDYDSTPEAGLVREGATKSRITCSDLLAVCDNNGYELPLTLSRMGVWIECKHPSTGLSYSFINHFFSVTPLIPVGGDISSNHYCWASPPAYTTEYVEGYYLHLEGRPRTYFSYLEVGPDNAIWLNFPWPMDIVGVYVFAYVEPYITGLDPPIYGAALEHLFEIDSIEIC